MTGTYTLLVALESAVTIEFGAAGERDLPAGRYAYTGSAFGAGGFARIERHRDVARGDNASRHWHVDYLLGSPESRLAGDVRTAGADAECAVARRLRDEIPAVSGVGATDCDCSTHLHGPVERGPDGAGELEQVVRRAHGDASSEP